MNIHEGKGYNTVFDLVIAHALIALIHLRTYFMDCLHYTNICFPVNSVVRFHKHG